MGFSNPALSISKVL